MSRLERLVGVVLLLVCLVVFGALAFRQYSAARYEAGFDAAIADRAERDAAAVLRRTEENTSVALAQGATNLKITETKHEELAPVVQRIYVDRVRVGTATCGPTATTEADDAASGNGADPAGRLVREDVERDTRTLDAQVEQHLATGRACQAWGKENGFMP